MPARRAAQRQLGLHAALADGVAEQAEPEVGVPRPREQRRGVEAGPVVVHGEDRRAALVSEADRDRGAVAVLHRVRDRFAGDAEDEAVALHGERDPDIDDDGDRHAARAGAGGEVLEARAEPSTVSAGG